MKVCYISHPIKGKTSQELAMLEAWGIDHVQNVLDMEPLLPRTIPVLDHGGEPCPQVMDAGQDVEHDWSCYMKADIIALCRADAILMMPGWPKSRGASFELQVAQTIGLPIHFYREDLN